MSKRRGILFLVIAVTAGAAAGSVGTWRYMKVSCDEELLSLWLAAESEKASILATILTLNEEEQVAKLTQIGELHLESSLYQTGRLTRDGARLGGPTPSLIHGVSQARDYAAKHSLGGVREADWFLEQAQRGL